MSVTYQVRFTCYQHNCGGGELQNGYKRRSLTFKTLEIAEKTAEFIKRSLETENRGRNWVCEQRFVHDGYLHSFDGIYKIVEQRME
jgi:hypothetical protein